MGELTIFCCILSIFLLFFLITFLHYKKINKRYEFLIVTEVILDFDLNLFIDFFSYKEKIYRRNKNTGMWETRTEKMFVKKGLFRRKSILKIVHLWEKVPIDEIEKVLASY